MSRYGERIPPAWVEELAEQLAEIAAEVLDARPDQARAVVRLRHRYARIIAAFVPEKVA